jgi:hypothetical protein
VVKWSLDANGSVWALQSDGNLLVNGVVTWSNKADFGFDAQNRAVLQDTAANGGTLVRSKLASGSGGWDTMGTKVTEWAFDANGGVWALQSDGNLLVNGVALAGGVRSFVQSPSGSFDILKNDGTALVTTGVTNLTPAYTGSQKVLQIVSVAAGILTVFDGGGVYLSPDGLNLGGGGKTVLVYSGSQHVVSVQAFKGGVLTQFDGGGLYLSPDGRNLGGGSTTLVDGSVASFAVAPNGRVYVLRQDGTFLQSDDGRAGHYATIDGGVLSFAIASGGRVYALKNNGVLMASDDGRAGYYSTAATNVNKFLINPVDGNLYTLTGDSWLSVNGTHSWLNTTDFGFGADGTLYQLDTGGALSHRNAASTWQSVAGNVDTFVVKSDGSVTTTPLAWVDPKTHTLIVSGSLVDDNIRVSGGLTISGLAIQANPIVVQRNGRTVISVPYNQVSQVAVLVGGGSDTVNCAGLPVPVDIDGRVIKGRVGNNFFIGGSRDDVIYGGAGTNQLVGGYGNDHLFAGVGGNNDLDPYYANNTGDSGSDPYGAGGSEGNDWYTVPGSGWIQNTYEYRIVHRNDGTWVRVREDNPGKDQLEFNGGIDHLDDDGFWSDVGEVIEKALPAIVGGAITLLTAGAGAPTLFAGLFGNFVGQVVSVVGYSQDFSWVSMATSLVGAGADAVGGLFGSSFTVAGSQALGTAVKTITVAAVNSLGTNVVNVLAGGKFNIASVFSGIATAAAGQVGNLFGKDFTVLGSQALGQAVQGAATTAAKSLASNLGALATGGKFDVTNLLSSVAGAAVSGGLTNAQLLGSKPLDSGLRVLATGLASQGVQAALGGTINWAQLASSTVGAVVGETLKGLQLLPDQLALVRSKAVDAAMTSLASSMATDGVLALLKGHGFNWGTALAGAISAGATAELKELQGKQLLSDQYALLRSKSVDAAFASLAQSVATGGLPALVAGKTFNWAGALATAAQKGVTVAVSDTTLTGVNFLDAAFKAAAPVAVASGINTLVGGVPFDAQAVAAAGWTAGAPGLQTWGKGMLEWLAWDLFGTPAKTTPLPAQGNLPGTSTAVA